MSLSLFKRQAGFNGASANTEVAAIAMSKLALVMSNDLVHNPTPIR